MSGIRFGVDVGSTTVKAVALDGRGQVLWKDYRRHHARQAELVLEFVSEIESRFGRSDLEPYVTGSGGRALAPYLGAEYVQEVNATAYAVERMYPDTGSVIELGGQDAKVIIFKPLEDGRRSTVCSMNDKCAGGTGATIDKIFSKVGLPLAEAARISADGKTRHPIAAKCGVFAETDVVGLLKSGVDREEIFVSLCAAIVKQNLEVLVRGNLLRDKVVLLGGPHRFIPALAEIWRTAIPEQWELHGWRPADLPIEELVFVPPDAEYVAAVGAVLFGAESSRIRAAAGGDGDHPARSYDGLERLERYIDTGRLERLTTNGFVRPGLVDDDQEAEEFARRYSIPEFAPVELAPGQTLPVWIGVDGGSTSSKLALIDERGELVYKDYKLSDGNPIADVRELFAGLGRWVERSEGTIDVRGAAVTGYASEILATAFAFDLQVVETVAHLRSAQFHYGDVDIVCDVGGQDIKVLFLRDGRVSDFKLNTQCSAGNGYFLQWIAEQFDVPIERFAELAFRARRAPNFNCGCAVFMEQDKVNFQQLGWTKEEIMAGLALVLPLNIWNYVVQESNLARFGSRFVLQGGTQKNLAAVKAQVDFIGRKVPDAQVHVHRYADLCGAIGAAIEIKDQPADAPRTFVGIDRAAEVAFRSRNDDTTRCRFCTNRCPRTFVEIDLPSAGAARFISGNACEKGSADDVKQMKREERRRLAELDDTPNTAQLAAEMVFEEFDFEPMPAGVRTADDAEWERRRAMAVGIPKLLNLFFYAPFFNVYLRCLGVGRVVYSDFTTTKLWEQGNKFGSIDPCFPAKAAPALVYDLLKRDDLTHVMIPMVTHLPSHIVNTLGNNACVIQMGTSEVVEAVFTKNRDLFSLSGIEFLKPFVKLDRPAEAEDQLFDYFEPRLGVSAEENAWAVGQAYDAQQRYLAELQRRGREVIGWLERNDRMGIVVLGHPYHHDPELNHGLLREFQQRGYPILAIESLPVDDEFLRPLFAGGSGNGNGRSPLDIKDVWNRNFNRNTNHKVWAAKVVARHRNLAGIDLSSFKCGHDAPTYSYVENIMAASSTPHFLFHDIDQNKPRASMKIRLQTFDYFLRLEMDKLRAAGRS
jgi:predicted CoA-substrate-specific enzyme activase